LGITLGVMTSFTIFTLFISYLEKIFPINPNALRLVATIIIALLGLSLLIPSLGARFEVLINNMLGPLQSKFKKEGDGLGAGLVTGFSLGLVWAPCAGPILATIATLSATQSVNIKVVMVTLAYVLGLGIPLYIFSTFSAGLFKKMRSVNKYTGIIQQIFGLVMIITAVLIYTNYAQVLQARVLNLFPGYSRFLGQFEKNNALQKQLDDLAGRKTQTIAEDSQLLSDGGSAPEFAGIAHWLNVASPLSLQDLRGKVVLVDFWTYSCINCVRTLPHLTAWYDRYKNDGLVIVGVHTPEFAFERETQNVANAIKQFGITYPVAQDNDYKTWGNYQNHYWPAEYLIDAKGHIRHVHFGEGSYDHTEEAIRALLKENGHTIEGDLSVVKTQVAHQGITPETYLGARRAPKENSPVSFQGTWQRLPQRAVSGAGAVLILKFKADKVFLVAGAAHTGDNIKVYMDEKPMNDVILDVQRLYAVIDLKGVVGSHTLRLEFPNPGTSVYAFTFG
jgi:cytochrome c biogenesis protein CcdA/thiol-disulfide isomerase/thioredoxin